MMSKKVTLAFVLTLVFVMLLAITGASAEANSDAVVTLTADQTDFAASQEVVIYVTIANPTNHTIKVLKWYTPAEEVEEPLFAVNRDGEPVSYTGAIYKRPQPTGNDYVSLKAGESLTRAVPLSQYYDLSVTGSYSIAYDVASWNLSSEKGGGNFDKVETLTSNSLELKIEGRQSAVSFDAAALAAAAGSTSFTKCTTSQQSTLNTARTQASTYASGALGYLQSGLQGLRYTTWFGVYNSSRYNTVTNHFSSISNAWDNAAVTFNCGCKKKYYAYVYPTQPYTIYVCSVFWTAPMTGTDSKAGTLIHEMSHFNVVASTDDFVYGQAGAKNLAITDPAKAINNADNHEYFAENTPAQP